MCGPKLEVCDALMNRSAVSPVDIRLDTFIAKCLWFWFTFQLCAVSNRQFRILKKLYTGKWASSTATFKWVDDPQNLYKFAKFVEIVTTTTYIAPLEPRMVFMYNYIYIEIFKKIKKNYFTTSGACGTGWPSSFHIQLPSPAATKYLGLQMLLSASRTFRTVRSASSTLRFASLALSHCLFITFSVRSDQMTTDSFGDKPCTETYQHRIRTCPQHV